MSGKTLVKRPMYIYTVGSQLCGTHARITDFRRTLAPALVQCFHSLPGRRFGALAFHIYADLLFFAEVRDQRIYRMRMETAGEHIQNIADNTGKVGGQQLLQSSVTALAKSGFGLTDELDWTAL